MVQVSSLWSSQYQHSIHVPFDVVVVVVVVVVGKSCHFLGYSCLMFSTQTLEKKKKHGKNCISRVLNWNGNNVGYWYNCSTRPIGDHLGHPHYCSSSIRSPYISNSFGVALLGWPMGPRFAVLHFEYQTDTLNSMPGKQWWWWWWLSSHHHAQLEHYILLSKQHE